MLKWSLCMYVCHDSIMKCTQLILFPSQKNGNILGTCLIIVPLLGNGYESQGLHSLHDRGSKRGSLFISKKHNFRICVNYAEKSHGCFCIGKFDCLSCGKLKHANFNFRFGWNQNYMENILNTL